MTVLARRSPRFRTGAALAAMALLLAACSSDDGGVAAPPATAPSAGTPADTPAQTPGGETIVPDTAAVGTTAVETTAVETTAEEPAEVPDADAEGVCQKLPVATVAGLLGVDLDNAFFSDVGTVPECTYSSTYAIYGYTVGILPGGAAEYDEQLQIRDMTSGGDAVVTTEPINGVDASLSVFTDMVGYPTASLMMVQGSDLIVVRGNGAADAPGAEIAGRVTTLAGYVASTVVG